MYQRSTLFFNRCLDRSEESQSIWIINLLCGILFPLKRGIMSYIDSATLRTAPCVSLAPMYKKNLEQQYNKANALVNPHPAGSERHAVFERDRARAKNQMQKEIDNTLVALRFRFAVEMEKLFKEKGARRIILGCMHSDPSIPFHQTTTDVSDLLPKEILPGEDHRHPSAVTFDTRCAPQECNELPMRGGSLLTTVPIEKIPTGGPDFARRDCENISHLEDLLYVEKIEKIYAERLPFLEKGPLDHNGSNIPFFLTIHRLLGRGGIFAFDYSPNYNMVDSKGEAVRFFSVPTFFNEVSQSEIDDLIKNSPHSAFFSLLKEGRAKMPAIACEAHRECPVKPCSSLITQIARTSLAAQTEKKVIAAMMDLFRLGAKMQPKAVLKKEELCFEIDGKTFSLAAQSLPIDKFKKCAILIKFLSKRTFAEMSSVYYQLECYRALNVDPSKEAYIEPETKRAFDSVVTLMADKVVFPQLRLLGFDKVAFDPNRQNPENKRPFERVIYVKKA